MSSFDVDVQVVRDAVKSVIALGKDVVLVMHSYAAIPGCEALKYIFEKNKDNRYGKTLMRTYQDGEVKERVYQTYWACREAGLPRSHGCPCWRLYLEQKERECRPSRV